MNDTLLRQILLTITITVISIIANIALGMYRMHRRSRRGPTSTEVADAVLTLRHFIVHHNRRNEKSKIISLTVHRDDPQAEAQTE